MGKIQKTGQKLRFSSVPTSETMQKDKRFQESVLQKFFIPHELFHVHFIHALSLSIKTSQKILFLITAKVGKELS